MSFLSKESIKNIGFKSVGDNVFISEKASFYSPELMSIGSNVRIDDFCILSGEIVLHNYIHISAYSALYGRFGNEMESFTGLSPRTTIFSASDDFSGQFMISPMVPKSFSNVTGGKVLIKEYSQIGAGAIIMPNLIIESGSVLGAMSFLKKSTKPWSVYSGCPAKFIKNRKKDIIDISKPLR